ncbi:mucin-associated surface protein [Arthrobacter sp. ISL-65]|uniref:mucin-associated surface protein n=1 Tax=Arthrobacter sp. ISL-65 TaxID=2819112 RepID=UPI001BEA27BE|nr:mucin-associated surface protein [Arthrobacter sp. ISL-65]MBT2548334.1 mucin-associated surface protein [Arthrobacter sp. ISL-65]
MSPSRAPAVWRRATTILTGCMLAAGLAGCAGAAPELEMNAAAKLQQQVLEVTKSAAGGNPAAALKSLDRLSSDLDAAAAAGHVSFKRHRSVTAAINSVRADLTAAQAAKKAAAEAAAQAAAAKPTAAPKPLPTTAPEVVVPAPAPAPVPVPANSGRQDNSSKGSSEGNKDKGSGKNKD